VQSKIGQLLNNRVTGIMISKTSQMHLQSSEMLKNWLLMEEGGTNTFLKPRGGTRYIPGGEVRRAPSYPDPV